MYGKMDTSTDGSSIGGTSLGDISFSLKRHSDKPTRRNVNGSEVAWILISRCPSLKRRMQPFKSVIQKKIKQTTALKALFNVIIL